MTSQLARLYVLVVGVLVFFVAWAAIAAHPWAAKPAQDPRIAALAARQHQLQVESVRVKQDRGRALDELPPAARGATCNGREPRPDASICPGRQPAPARRHEVVMKRRAFHAMGTTVELVLDAHDGQRALDAAESEFERLEQIMSRFRPTSELSCLNRDRSIDASPELAEVVGLALDARERTGGRFDPTVHDALVAAGYDRTFEELPPRRTAATGSSVWWRRRARRPSHHARRRCAPRPRRHRQGLRGGAGRGAARARRPVPRQRRRRRRRARVAAGRVRGPSRSTRASPSASSAEAWRRPASTGGAGSAAVPSSII